MYKTFQIEVRTRRSDEMVDVTKQVEDALVKSGICTGVMTLFVPHTTAGITINENADPDVKSDMLLGLTKVFPEDKAYHHYEGNSHAHIKSSVIGVTETILVDKNKMLLGTWQGIYFMEFDGPRNRNLVIRISGE